MCWLNHLGTTADAHESAVAPARSTSTSEPTAPVDWRLRSLKIVAPTSPVVASVGAGRERVLVRTA